MKKFEDTYEKLLIKDSTARIEDNLISRDNSGEPIIEPKIMHYTQ